MHRFNEMGRFILAAQKAREGLLNHPTGRGQVAAIVKHGVQKHCRHQNGSRE